ncbi:MAG: hypothetical protein JW929_15065 [Anaerolineales bacterium]|nr:hypothetical protein [Anaerolineales bacterium]
MNRLAIIAALSLAVASTACSPDGAASQESPAAPPEYGYMLQPLTAEEASPFAGTWKGSISGFDFTLWIAAEDDRVSALLEIDGQTESLFVLSANETTLYLFRDRDNACISLYADEGGRMIMEYYEQGAPRVIPLRKG